MAATANFGQVPYNEALRDSPAFRQALRAHEAVVDGADSWARQLAKEGRAAVSAMTGLFCF